MVERDVAYILSQYGQNVRVYTPKTPGGEVVRALVQPMREKGTEQSVPSPLGRVKQDRFLYLGPSGTEMDETSRVEWNGECFRVRSAHSVRVGGSVTHWWAVLSRRAQEVSG